MKIKALTIVIFIITLFVSCNNDEENPTQQPPSHPIEGKWSLLSVKPNFGGETIFQPGETIWEFKKQNKIQRTINIELTNYNIARLYPYHVSGTQNYQLEEADTVNFELDYMPEGQTIWTYPYRIEGDTLIMGFYSASDGGLFYKFSRY